MSGSSRDGRAVLEEEAAVCIAANHIDVRTGSDVRRLPRADFQARRRVVTD